MTIRNCPCGSKKHFDLCCERILLGKRSAGTPEELMRSRYSAFCMKNIDYLIDSHHPDERDGNARAQLAETIKKTTWLGLKIISVDNSEIAGSVGYVEFAAFYKSGSYGQLHEKSRFVKEDGKWYYVDGVIMPPITIGRNEPCWCGSGLKYKKCHK